MGRVQGAVGVQSGRDGRRRRRAGGARAGQAQPLRTAGGLATCAAEGRAPRSYARDLRYALSVPMRAAGRTIGVLSLRSGGRRHCRADEELLTTVGALLALRLTRPSER